LKRVQDTEDRVTRLFAERPSADAWERADRVVEQLWESFAEPHFRAAVEGTFCSRSCAGRR
jgi:hypothetical protein